MDFVFEAAEVKVFQVSELKKNKIENKTTSRALGYAKNKEEAEKIINGVKSIPSQDENIEYDAKMTEKTALLIKRKNKDDDSAKHVIVGKSFNFIHFIENSEKLPFEQHKTYSIEQQKFLNYLAEKKQE